MQDPINNKNLTTTNSVASLTKKDDEKIKKQINNNNSDEDEENDEESGESSDGGKKKKKGKKKKERKRLKKLIEIQQLQIEQLEKERYQQQLHINQLSGIDEGGDTMINPSSTNNSSTNYNYTDITIPPPTVTNPIGDINWLDTNNNNDNNKNKNQPPQTNIQSSISNNSLLIPPPPQKVVQNIKPKKGSIYENEIQAFGKRTTSTNGGINFEDDGVSYNNNNNNNNKVKSRNFFKFNSNGGSENDKKQSDKKEPKVSLSALAAAQGKKIPVWRKVLSDDSKLFSNERTWMSWVGTTFSLGAIGTSIITFFGTESLSLFTGLCLWVIALGFLVYSYIIFRLRRKAIITKGKGPFDDRYGPIALVVMVMLSITLFLVFFIIKKPEPLAKRK